jgi:hypothetical protein
MFQNLRGIPLVGGVWEYARLPPRSQFSQKVCIYIYLWNNWNITAISTTYSEKQWNIRRFFWNNWNITAISMT